MVKGNFDDDASLAAAMHGAYGVFAVTDFWEHGYDKEVDHGKKLIDAAKNAGVNHFVFTSVAGSNANTGIPHFDSKAEIEEYLRESGIDYSIVRPVSFMDNFRYFRKQVMTGSFYDPRAGDKNHQWIAARDIGFFVGDAITHADIAMWDVLDSITTWISEALINEFPAVERFFASIQSRPNIAAYLASKRRPSG